jgi:acetylornithine/succinyldiaminopimelate/putrescine aminotransferase
VEDETIGRAGVWITSTLWRRQPDIVVLGSALAWGEPFAAVLVSRLMPPAIMRHLPRTEGRSLPQSTVNRVAGALGAMQSDDVLGHARRVAEYFEDRLRSLRETCPQIHSLDMAGLCASVGLAPTLNAGKVKRELCRRGVLAGVHNLFRLKLAPPLCIRPAEVDVIIGVLRGALLGLPTWREAACCNVCAAN